MKTKNRDFEKKTVNKNENHTNVFSIASINSRLSSESSYFPLKDDSIVHTLKSNRTFSLPNHRRNEVTVGKLISTTHVVESLRMKKLAGSRASNY